MIAALYVQPGGVYYGLPDVDPWDEKRDARLYAGPWPVVAHPPCARWSIMGSCRGYRDGEDGGCFAAALSAVRAYGGVLEHPAHSLAWERFALPEPALYGWTQCLTDDGYATMVDQSVYGHAARKPTWLYYVGSEPPTLDWSGWTMRTATVRNLGRGANTSANRSVTPLAFRDVLLDMARSVAKRDAKVHTATCQVKSPGVVMSDPRHDTGD